MANFNLFIPLLQQVEGKYQDQNTDSGNYNSLNQNVGTNYGISARFYEEIIKRPPTALDMKSITKTKAKDIYKIYFWDKIHGNSINNQSIANIIADHAVNAGEGSIAKIVQTILKYDFKKNVIIDGDIGPLTVALINNVNQSELFDKIKVGRYNFYKNIGGLYLSGWLNRLKIFVYSEKKQ